MLQVPKHSNSKGREETTNIVSIAAEQFGEEEKKKGCRTPYLRTKERRGSTTSGRR